MPSMEICLPVEEVVTFQRVDTLAPSASYNIELHRSFMSFTVVRKVNVECQIKYSDIFGIYVLPKMTGFLHHKYEPKTFVVLMLNSPVIRGRWSDTHVVLQFQMDSKTLTSLAPNEDHSKGSTQSLVKQDRMSESFTQCLSLRCEASITRHGVFRSSQDYAVGANLGADLGFLYPLEDRFLFIPRPPISIMYEEIESVEFVWLQQRNYFDLLVRMKTDKQYFLFEDIRSDEHVYLFDYLKSIGLDVSDVDCFPGGRNIYATLPGYYEDEDEVGDGDGCHSDDGSDDGYLIGGRDFIVKL